MELGGSAAPQGINGGNDDLHVRLLPFCTDELHPALGNLPAAAVVGRVGAVHRLVVVQPLGQGHRLQLGGRHPCNGGGRVGPHDAELTAGVPYFDHTLLGNGAARPGKEIIELGLRGRDLQKTPLAEQAGQLSLDLPPLLALGKQPVPGSFGGVDVEFHGITPFALSLYHANIL